MLPLLSLLLPSPSSAADVHVDPTGAIGGSHLTIALGMNAANPGDTVVLHGNTPYVETVAITKDLTLQAAVGDSPQITGGVTLVADATLDGITVSNPTGTAVSNTDHALTLLDVTLLDSNLSGGSGSGLNAQNGSLLAMGLVVSGNRSSGDGAGLQLTGTPATIEDAVFDDNQAVNGAHVYVSGVARVEIFDSTWSSGVASGDGGAVYVKSEVDFIRNVFCGNDAANGGALALGTGAEASSLNGRFVGNTSGNRGGAVYTANGRINLTNNTFVDNAATNRGAAVMFDSTNNWFINNVVAQHTGAVAAMQEDSGAAGGNNNVYWKNDDDEEGTGLTFSSSVVLSTTELFRAQTGDICTRPYLPDWSSPLRTGGDTTVTDPDGAISTVGSWGGPDADPATWTNADGDNIYGLWDCDDDDATIGEPELSWKDNDGDGYGRGAQEVRCPINGWVPVADEDCDDTDSGVLTASTWWYLDDDGDGFGDTSTGQQACVAPTNKHIEQDGDCDDSDANWHAMQDTWPDSDGDGYGDDSASATNTCGVPAGSADNNSDCDDSDAAVNPLTSWHADLDGDGYGAGAAEVTCLQPNFYVHNADDCDDNDASLNPETWWFTDGDGDGYGDIGSDVQQCDDPGNGVHVGGDCEDGNPSIHPNAYEGCAAGVDFNCDGIPQNNTLWPDADGDGYGDGSVQVDTTCGAPAGMVTNDLDCDDDDDTIQPDALEVCDRIDNDCNGQIDDDPTDGRQRFLDADGDGHGGTTTVNACDDATWASDLDDDCNDSDARVHPDAADVPDNGLDEDCDGADADLPVNRAPDDVEDGPGDGLAKGPQGCNCDAGGGSLSAAWVVLLLGLRRR